MITSQNFPLALAALLVLAISLARCGGGSDDSIDDCSRRGRPQYYDGKEWTCRDR